MFYSTIPVRFLAYDRVLLVFAMPLPAHRLRWVSWFRAFQRGVSCSAYPEPRTQFLRFSGWSHLTIGEKWGVGGTGTGSLCYEKYTVLKVSSSQILVVQVPEGHELPESWNSLKALKEALRRLCFGTMTLQFTCFPRSGLDLAPILRDSWSMCTSFNHKSQFLKVLEGGCLGRGLIAFHTRTTRWNFQNNPLFTTKFQYIEEPRKPRKPQD